MQISDYPTKEAMRIYKKIQSTDVNHENVACLGQSKWQHLWARCPLLMLLPWCSWYTGCRWQTDVPDSMTSCRCVLRTPSPSVRSEWNKENGVS